MGDLPKYADAYPRLRFRDGGFLDLNERVRSWEREDYARGWREVGVRVEWLRSPRGVIDHLLERYVTSPPRP